MKPLSEAVRVDPAQGVFVLRRKNARTTDLRIRKSSEVVLQELNAICESVLGFQGLIF